MLLVTDLKNQPYRSIWDLQNRLLKLRRVQQISDTLILVEHFPVYTLGKNGNRAHVLGNQEFMKKHQLEVIHVDRGGDVTCHLPGQLVGYPIFDLHQHHLSISWFMNCLEEILMDVLNHWGITATQMQGLRGVWIGDQKIGALGVKLTRWISSHGFALNVDPELELFQGIVPCGLKMKGVTSMQEQLKNLPSMGQVKMTVIEAFQQKFGFDQVRIQNERSMIESWGR